MKRALLTIVSMLLAIPSFAYMPGSSTLSIQGGVSGTGTKIDWASLGSGFNDQNAADAGGAVGGQYMIYAAPGLGFGFDVNYSALTQDDATDVGSGLNGSSRFRPTTYMAMMKLTRPRGFVRPYLFGGLGGHTTTMNLSLTPQSGLAWNDTGTTETRQIVDDTSAGFASAVGLGLDFRLAPGLLLGLEYRWTYLGTATYTVTPAGAGLGFSDVRTDLSMSSFLVRLGFHFGGWGGGGPGERAEGRGGYDY